jgi:type III restriction enzyme
MNLKQYQEEAVQKLFRSASDLLVQSSGKKIVLKAPTGAGKTIMMAEFLNLLATDALISSPISVIWTAPRKLHTQSMDKLKKYFEDTHAFKCSEFSGLTDKAIAPNEILFMNWESINKTEKNTIVKENEKEFYLEKVIQNTKDKGIKIILVIDESHHHATSEISKSLISDMQPDLTIEVSATPVLRDMDEMVVVQLEKVKDQGMIKKGVLLNPDFENTLEKDKVKSSLSSGTDLFVLDQGMAKLAELQKAFVAEASGVKPLLLIQLPDKKSDISDSLQDQLMDHLAEKYQITLANDKLAIYLSESKENLENIAKNDSPVEVMLFKQAIALGWDCPRAAILVLFRDHKSLTFSVQTVGRIMRMPEPNLGHYKNEILNHAYVFTNLADISINEDVSSGYLSVFTGKRKEDIPSLKLESVYRQRQREKTRLSLDFTRIFLEVADRTQLAKKLDVNNPQVKADFITNFRAESVDQLANSNIHGWLEVNLDSEQDLQKLFDFFVIKNLTPFFPERRSVGRVKEAIYRFFSQEMAMDYEQHQGLIFRTVLSEGNQVLVANVIDETKMLYQDLVAARDEQLIVQLDWTLPESVNYPSTHSLIQTKKSALVPFYSDLKWKSETAFVGFLDSSAKVDWWFKNGDRDATFFAVPYMEGTKQKPFYVDFIVGLKDGSLALFDTKGGQTIETAKTKSDGLQEYLKKHSGMFGGIVANTASDYSGRWVYFIKISDAILNGDFSNWETLEL